jgi:hypothetical protein
MGKEVAKDEISINEKTTGKEAESEGAFSAY